MFCHHLQHLEILLKCSVRLNGIVSSIFLKVLNIYLFSKIFQKVEILM